MLALMIFVCFCLSALIICLSIPVAMHKKSALGVHYLSVELRFLEDSLHFVTKEETGMCGREFWATVYQISLQ
jgi:hypothetical protein